MATEAQFSNHQFPAPERTPEAASFLEPIERPKGLILKIMYWYARRQWGKVPRPFSVFVARMPTAFGSFFGKVSKLDKKLVLSAETATLVRARVASLNMCMWCVDGERWFVTHKTPEHLPKLDALDDYRSSALFDDRQRAALDFATELTEHKSVRSETFAALARHHSEREICDIVWLVSSEHLYNLNNLGLNIGSDGLCQIGDRLQSAVQRPKPG